MTAPTDQFIDITKRSQDAFSTVARTWLDSLQLFTGTVAGGDTRVPDVHPYVDGLFDVAEKLLSSQREIAHQWVSAARRATEAVTEQAVRATKSVADHAANGTEAVVDNSADAARETGEQVAAAARIARPAGRG